MEGVNSGMGQACPTHVPNGNKSSVPHIGVEPMTLALLAPRSNQLS